MKEEYLKIFDKNKFRFARMISASKSSYLAKYPDHDVVFNSRIYLLDDFKNNQSDIKDFFKGMEIEIWYGDLDFTVDMDKLKKIQKEIGIPIVITTEMGRFRKAIPEMEENGYQCC